VKRVKTAITRSIKIPYLTIKTANLKGKYKIPYLKIKGKNYKNIETWAKSEIMPEYTKNWIASVDINLTKSWKKYTEILFRKSVVSMV